MRRARGGLYDDAEMALFFRRLLRLIGRALRGSPRSSDEERNNTYPLY